MNSDQVALNDLWASRDDRYALRRTELSEDEVSAIRAYRVQEARDIEAWDLATVVSRWWPPRRSKDIR